MEHLTKQQIVLLTLLVSFVTSIATGIVTVSLINQAPVNTTNTIEKVIENTVAAALPTDNLSAVNQSNTSSDTLISATDNIKKSVVEIGEYGAANSVSGLGVVVNASGTVMTDKSNISGLNKIAIAYPDGHSYGAAVVESQSNGDIVFLQPFLATDQSSLASTTSIASFNPVSVADFPKLGEMVASLGGDDAGTLGIGVVDKLISSGDSSTTSAVSTTISSSNVMPGSPLFDISGKLIGLQTSSLTSKTGTEFYLVQPIESAIPK